MRAFGYASIAAIRARASLNECVRVDLTKFAATNLELTGVLGHAPSRYRVNQKSGVSHEPQIATAADALEVWPVTGARCSRRRGWGMVRHGRKPLSGEGA